MSELYMSNDILGNPFSLFWYDGNTLFSGHILAC